MHPRGQRLGAITDFFMESTAGRVVYVVLAFGDVPLRWEKRLALSWQALQQSKGFDTFLLAVDAKELEEAPGVEHDHWPHTRSPSVTQGSSRTQLGAGHPGLCQEHGHACDARVGVGVARDRKESRSIAQTLSHWAEAWRLSSSCRA
jgi:hypothetical protein